MLICKIAIRGLRNEVGMGIPGYENGLLLLLEVKANLTSKL